mmetsp:Transcript_8540/g.25904  ORF Transcript_8540/g.25904 Transcript_8540/m.25904 type:complete len:216 (+) Transcript_8540:618-1265(+)
MRAPHERHSIAEVLQHVLQIIGRQVPVAQHEGTHAACGQPLRCRQALVRHQELVVTPGADDHSATAARLLDAAWRQQTWAVRTVEEWIVLQRWQPRPSFARGADDPRAFGANPDELTAVGALLAPHARLVLPAVLRGPHEAVPEPALRHGAPLRVEGDPVGQPRPRLPLDDGVLAGTPRLSQTHNADAPPLRAGAQTGCPRPWRLCSGRLGCLHC